jgi:D-aminopeptidase
MSSVGQITDRDPLPLGILARGPRNDITDVAGVRVGHVTLIHDEPSIARTGVTAILPTERPYWEANVYAGFHRYNGFGEVCGSHWIKESGLLTSPICTTSTYTVGLVRDAMLAHPYSMLGEHMRFHVPVCAETNDFFLNDGLQPALTREHVYEAIASAKSEPVEQGAVGGGVGMMSFGFKSGIGSASRIAETPSGPFTVGVLVQSNFGGRHRLTIDGVPVGRFIGPEEVPVPSMSLGGSIVVVIATDAPLIPTQCERLAQRAVVGLGRLGGYGANTSGDFVLAFSTAHQVPPVPEGPVDAGRMLPNMHITPIFHAAAEAVEAAVVNSLAFSPTMTGVKGRTIYKMPLDRVREILAAHRPSVELTSR